MASLIDTNASQEEQISEAADIILNFACTMRLFLDNAAGTPLTYTRGDGTEVTIESLATIIRDLEASVTQRASIDGLELNEEDANRLIQIAAALDNSGDPVLDTDGNPTYEYIVTAILPTLASFVDVVPTNTNVAEQGLAVTGQVTRNGMNVPVVGFRPANPQLSHEIVPNQTNANRMSKVNEAGTSITYGAKVPSASEFADDENRNFFLSSRNTTTGLDVEFMLRHGDNDGTFFGVDNNEGKSLILQQRYMAAIAASTGVQAVAARPAILGFRAANPDLGARNMNSHVGDSENTGKFTRVDRLNIGFELSNWRLPGSIGDTPAVTNQDAVNYGRHFIVDRLARGMEVAAWSLPLAIGASGSVLTSNGSSTSFQVPAIPRDNRINLNSEQNRFIFSQNQGTSPNQVLRITQSSLVFPSQATTPPETAAGGIRQTLGMFIDEIMTEPVDPQAPTNNDPIVEMRMQLLAGTLPLQSTPSKIGKPLVGKTSIRRNRNDDPIDRVGNVVPEDDPSALLYTYDTIDYVIPSSIGTAGQVPTVISRMMTDSSGNVSTVTTLEFATPTVPSTSDLRIPTPVMSSTGVTGDAVTGDAGKILQVNSAEDQYVVSNYIMPTDAPLNRNALVGSRDAVTAAQGMIDSGISLPLGGLFPGGGTRLRDGALLIMGTPGTDTQPIQQTNLNVVNEIPDIQGTTLRIMGILGSAVDRPAGRARSATVSYHDPLALGLQERINLLQTFAGSLPSTNVQSIPRVNAFGGLQSSNVRMFTHSEQALSGVAAARTVVIRESGDNVDQLRVVNTTLNPVTVDANEGMGLRVSASNEIEYIPTTFLPKATTLNEGMVPVVTSDNTIQYQTISGSGTPSSGGGSGDSTIIGLNRVDNNLAITTGAGTFNLTNYEQVEIIPGAGNVVIEDNNFIVVSSMARLNLGLTAISSYTENGGQWQPLTAYPQNTIVVYERQEYITRFAVTASNNNPTQRSNDVFNRITDLSLLPPFETVTTTRGDMVTRTDGALARLPLGNAGEHLIVSGGEARYGEVPTALLQNTISTSSGNNDDGTDPTQGNPGAGFDQINSIYMPSLHFNSRNASGAGYAALPAPGITPTGNTAWADMNVSGSPSSLPNANSWKRGTNHNTIKDSRGEIKLLGSRTLYNGRPDDYGAISHTSSLQTNLGAVQQATIRTDVGSSTIVIDEDGVPYFRALNVTRPSGLGSAETQPTIDLNQWFEIAPFRANGFEVVDYRRIFYAVSIPSAPLITTRADVAFYGDLVVFLTSTGRLFYFFSFNNSNNISAAQYTNGFFQFGLQFTPTEITAVTGVSEIISFDALSGGKEGYMPGIWVRHDPGDGGGERIVFIGTNISGCAGTPSVSFAGGHLTGSIPTGLPANTTKIFTGMSMDLTFPVGATGTYASRLVNRACSYVISDGVLFYAGDVPGISSIPNQATIPVANRGFVSAVGRFFFQGVKLLRSATIRPGVSSGFVTTDNNMFEAFFGVSDQRNAIRSRVEFSGFAATSNDVVGSAATLRYVSRPSLQGRVLKCYQNAAIYQTFEETVGPAFNPIIRGSTGFYVLTTDGLLLTSDSRPRTELITRDYGGALIDTFIVSGMTKSIAEVIVLVQLQTPGGRNAGSTFLIVYRDGTFAAHFQLGVTGDSRLADIRN